LTIKIDNYS